MGRESVDLLEKMLGEMRAEDVRILRVDQISKMKRGKTITKKYIEKHPGEYPVYSSQTINDGELGKIDTYMYDGEYVTWTTGGANAGTVFYRNGKFNANSDCGVIKVTDDQVDARYLCFALSIRTKERVMNPWNNGKLGIERVAEIEIPLPPLEIQKLIGENLWLMEQNLKNIKKELEIRQGQYEFYRDVVVGLDKEYLPDDVIEMIRKMCPNGVERKKLGEIGQFYSGLSGKTKKDFKDGNAKYITYKNVYANCNADLDAAEFVCVAEGEKQRSLKKGDVIFTGSSETPHDVGMTSVITEELEEPYYLNSFCFFFRLFEENLILPDYAKFMFRAKRIRKDIVDASQGVIRYNLSRRKLLEMEVPIPPLEVQQMIVEILEPFEGICRDLKKAEKIMRGKFEFCRDEILKF